MSLPTRSILAAFGTLCLAGTLPAQTVATDPVGFGSTVVQAGTVAALSVPFDRVAAFQGAISSRTSTTVTTTGANFGTFGPFSANPHVVVMLSGANTGRNLIIDSNTTDTLTIANEGDLTGQIAAGDKYKVVPCHTLESLFGADGAGLNNTNSATTADNVQLREGGAWITYFHTANPNGFWAKVGGGSGNFNKKAILPEQGLLLVRRAGSSYTFTGIGTVPTTNLKTDLPANAVSHFTNRFPKDTTLNALGLHTAPGWISGSSANATDNVQIRIGGAWQTFFHTSGAQGFWAKVGGGSGNFNAEPIPLGASVLVVRRPGTDIVLDQPLPYTLN